MKPIYLSLLLLFIAFATNAQNLVTNGNFEGYTTCPTSVTQISNCTGWQTYGGATPDYFNACVTTSGTVGVPDNFGGYQYAASGNGYAGIAGYSDIANVREYITRSIAALTVNGFYEVSMSVSLGENAMFASDGLGISFFNSPPAYVGYECLTLTPQVSFNSSGVVTDDQNWTRLTGYFTADSAYANILIGGFIQDANLNTSIHNSGVPSWLQVSYYYVDSIVLLEKRRIDIQYTNQNLCIGGPISVPYTLRVPSYFTAGNVFTLQLSNASGSFSSPVNIGTVTSTAAGTITGTIPTTTTPGTGYRVRVISSAGIDSSFDNGINISISAYPNVTAASNSPLCQYSTLNLSATTVTGAFYEWTGPDSYYSNTQNPGFPATNSATQSGDYIVSTTVNYCTSYDTVTVLIKPDPGLGTATRTPVCPGTTFWFNATALAGSTFTWSGPGGFSSNLADVSWPNATYSDAGPYTVTAALNGCTNTVTINIDVRITTATPVAGSNSPVCEGFPLDLTALSATSNATYNWTGPLGYTSTQQNPTQTASTNHNGYFIVTATFQDCVSLPDTVDVLVYPKPYLGNYASPNDTVCEGTIVTFVTVPMSGVVNPVFQWFKNNTLVPGATNLTLIAPYATGDTFYCRTYCQNQCGDNLTLYSNKVGMTVMPIVNDLSITLWSEPAQPLPGNPITFHATTVSGGYTPKYQWKKNGSDIFGATSAIYNANNLAPYDKITCCVITSDPCANPTTACSDAMVVNFPTSVGEVGNDDIFQLYPNPNDGYFKLKMQNVKCKSIEVINVSGQVVYQTKPQAPQAEYIIDLPQQLPPGVYMLRAYSDSNMYRKSFTLSK